MEVIICADAARAETLVAALVSDRVRKTPDIVLGLATGRTMIGVYERLAGSGASFAKATTFNLDEYVGLDPADPRSFAGYMARHFLSVTDADPARVHLPDGMASDLALASAAYEAAIADAGGIALQLLGIGRTGHIGFNEPVSSLRSRTRDKLLTPATREQNAGDFDGRIEDVPRRAITMGVGTILDSAELVLLAVGKGKAGVVRRAVEGPVTSQVSASAIQFHNDCKVVLDEEAAAELERRDYYDFVFRHEPKWDTYRELVRGGDKS